MEELRPRIAKAFEERRVRHTPQRYAVMEHLLRNGHHATAEEVFHAINRDDPRASRATVYNALHALAEAGLVREVALEGNSTRFDAVLDRHHHFVCDACGGIEDIEWFDLDEASLAAVKGARQVRDLELVIRGVCCACISAERVSQ